MADLTYPMALGASLDSLHTAAASAETYLRAWEWDGRLAQSEDRLKNLPAGTPAEILRKADHRFGRLFYAMESCMFFLQDAVNELEKSPLGREEKRKVYAQLYETAKRLQNVIHDIRYGTEADGGPQERYPAFFRHLDWTLSQELAEPALRKYQVQYTLFNPQPLMQEAGIPLELKLEAAAEEIRGRTTAGLVQNAMAEGAKRKVDYEYYSKNSEKYEKVEPPELDLAGMAAGPLRTTGPLKPQRPKNRSEIFKFTPLRIHGAETARSGTVQNAADTPLNAAGVAQNAAAFTAGGTHEGPVVYDVIAGGVEGYSGADRMLKGTKTGRAASILDQYFGLGLFEGHTAEERKRAYNDFLKEMGHSPEFVALVANVRTYRQDGDGKMVERRSSSGDLRMDDIVGISQQLLASPRLALLVADFKAAQEQKRSLAGAEQTGLPKRIAQMR